MPSPYRRAMTPADRKRWLRVRARLMRREIYCRHCRDEGRWTVAEEVDHIKPVARGGAMWDVSNLQPLCKACHRDKSVMDNRRADVLPNGEVVRSTPYIVW